MTVVTASAVIGASPRYRGGVDPSWMAFFHEGNGAAWQFIYIDLFGDAPEQATPANRPGGLWINCPTPQAPIDLLRLGIHLWCTDPGSDVAALLRADLDRHGIRQTDRLDITSLGDPDIGSLLQLARTSPGSDPTVMLSIYSTSSLRGAAGSFFTVPGWQGEWAESAGGQFYTALPEEWRTWTDASGQL